MASDKRREKLGKGIEKTVSAIQKGDVRGAINVLRDALKLLEQEGLVNLSGEVYESLARIYWAVGDKKRAREHAEKAVNYLADFDSLLEPRNRTEDLESMLRKFDS